MSEKLPYFLTQFNKNIIISERPFPTGYIKRTPNTPETPEILPDIPKKETKHKVSSSRDYDINFVRRKLIEHIGNIQTIISSQKRNLVHGVMKIPKTKQNDQDRYLKNLLDDMLYDEDYYPPKIIYENFIHLKNYIKMYLKDLSEGRPEMCPEKFLYFDNITYRYFVNDHKLMLSHIKKYFNNNNKNYGMNCIAKYKREIQKLIDLENQNSNDSVKNFIQTLKIFDIIEEALDDYPKMYSLHYYLLIKFLYDISHIKWGLRSISEDIDKVYVERVELN